MINEAYEILGDKIKKEWYDQMILGSTNKKKFYSSEFKQHAREKQYKMDDIREEINWDEWNRKIAEKLWSYKDYNDFLKNFKDHQETHFYWTEAY